MTGAAQFMTREDLVHAQLHAVATSDDERKVATAYAVAVWDARDDVNAAAADDDRGFTSHAGTALLAAERALAAAEQSFRAALTAYRAEADRVIGA